MKSTPLKMLILTVITLPVLISGCSKTPSASPSQSVTPQNSANNATTTGSSNASTGASTQSNGGTSTSGQTSASTGTSGSGNTTSTNHTTGASHVILYPPTVYALNTVRVSGRMEGSGGNRDRAVTVSAKFTGTNETIVSTQVMAQANGQFAADLKLPVHGNGGPWLLSFTASSSTGGTAGVTRYFTTLDTSSSPTQLTVMASARTEAEGQGADFPVQLPTWLPQSVTTTPPEFPAYSMTMAAKSFTYNAQIIQTTKSFPINSQAMFQASPTFSFATISGQQFTSASAAEAQLMWHSKQSLPPASTANHVVHLGGNLNAIVYADTWHTVIWHEGDWLLVTRGPSEAQNVTEAEQITQILNGVYLPPTHGVVWVRNISDGTNTPAVANTDVSYVIGQNLYDVNTQNDEVYDALVMAASMRG